MKISVLMPIYNTKHEHLKEAIQSILSQTFTDFEFLILNDASTDLELEGIVKSFDDPRIIYTVNERNLGISGSRNKLMSMAKGEYLAVMDHDDISLPERLEKEAAFLDTHPEVGICSCQTGSPDSDRISNYPLDSISIKKSLLILCQFVHSACMIRASVLKQHHISYEEMFSPSEDYALFCRLLPHTEFAILPDVLFLYRNWKGNTSHKRKAAMGSATSGIQNFARRENPVLWAMAQYHLVRSDSIRLFGIPLFMVYYTRKYTLWKLFNLIPVLKIRHRSPEIN